jgi:hypothetical protein
MRGVSSFSPSPTFASPWTWALHGLAQEQDGEEGSSWAEVAVKLVPLHIAGGGGSLF